MTNKSKELPGEIKDKEKIKLVSELLKGEPDEEARYVFVLEHLRTTKKYGFIKFEVFSAKKTMLRVKLQQHIPEQLPNAPFPINNQQNQFDWTKLQVGKRELIVGLLDVESKTLFEKLKEGFEVALEEGRVPFFPG